MGTAVIIAVLLLAAFFALRSSAKHFRGEGGCCGGGGSVPKQKKRLKNVQYRKRMEIQGMHCKNCKNSVEKALNALDGVAAKVNLKGNYAEISMERQVPDEVLTSAVEAAGFRAGTVSAL